MGRSRPRWREPPVNCLPNRLLGRRGQSGLPSLARWAPVSILRLMAHRRRAAGWYDARTLALFRRAWVRGRSAAALLGYVAFRRDLGLPLSSRQARLLAQAVENLPEQPRRAALDMLAEKNALPLCRFAASPSDEVHATVRGMQAAWRAEYAQWLRRHRSGGVWVVGNASSLLAAGLGPHIDRQEVVARFNAFRGEASNSADIGERVDVWVTAPDFRGDAPRGVRWVIVTGPDMAYRMRDWRRFEAPLLAGSRVLTVPLEAWRELVAQVLAPPSAGLLFLAWIRLLLGSWAGVRAVGFGGPDDRNGRYHHALPRHKPAGRHHWPAERAVLRRWQHEGLHIDCSA